LGSTLAPVPAANAKVDTSLTSRAFDFAPSSSARIGRSDSPRAQLRNEAPRAIGVDPDSPAAIHRRRSEDVNVTDPDKIREDKAAPPLWSAPQLLTTGYTEGGPSPPATMPASYTRPVNSLTENQLAPPPWPTPNDEVEPRTHIVVDGDSLERLANRYLSDPQRSREIYELNREVLSAPDLLPIGAELRIPERVASASWERSGFQPNPAIAGPGREIDGKNKTTLVRPPSAPQEIIPRAQLAAPVMVQ
jgi:nucleoid-associated protein YgaU